MRSPFPCRCVWLVLLPAMLVLIKVNAQDGNVVTEGQIKALGAVQVPGDSYIWKIYTDHTLQNEAGPGEVAFVYGNAGPYVPVLWQQEGTYYFTVTAVNMLGCMNLKVGVMLVNPACQNLVIGGQTHPVLCYGEPTGSVDLTATGGSPPYTFAWNNGATTEDISGVYAGTYTVTVTDMLGCVVTDTLVIPEPSQPLTVMATATGVNCVDANNGTVTAAVSGGTPGYRYLWDDPMAQTTPTAIRLFAGTYTVVVTDTNNCTVTASATVGEPVTREPQITISIDHNPVCRGTRVHFTSNVVFSGPDPVYQWIKNGVSVGSNDSVYSDSTLQDKDVINCILTSSEPCAIPATKVSDGIRINVKDPPDAAFTITTLNGNPTGRIQLNNYSTGADAYQWDFGNGQTSAEENPTVSYTQDGDYLIRLVALDDYSCSDTAYNKHLVEFFGLYIPNAFAPESGVYPANVFKPAGANLKQYRIEVYDSWGYLLWESTALDSEGSPLESWDGTYRGKLMPQGTYMWKVNAIFNDGRIWQGCDVGKGMGKTIGTVTLIR